jgi:hypothetical protein
MAAGCMDSEGVERGAASLCGEMPFVKRSRRCLFGALVRECAILV